MRIETMGRVQGRKARRVGRARPRLYFPFYFLCFFPLLYFLPLFGGF